jgi:hypothetical protein
MIFPKYLEVLKEFYGNPHACGVTTSDKSVNGVCHYFQVGFGCSTKMFKLIMKYNVAKAMTKISTLTINKLNP